MDHDWLELIEADSARLGALAAAAPDLLVPTCPDWTARDLLLHLAEVQRFWAVTTARAGAAPVHVPEPDRPPDDMLASYLADATTALLDAFRAAGPDGRTWAWWADGRPVPVADSMRRQAHEALIHRVDAEQACGLPSELAADLAADGVQEWLERYGAELRGTAHRPQRLLFEATDTGHRWLVELGDHRPRLLTVDGAADAVVSGSAASLDLLVWRRVRLGGDGAHATAVAGDRALAEFALTAADLT